jgi:GT2 family glycosyltransferase
MRQPWLSIVIPTYNGEKYLAQALDSVVIQNDRDLECIIIDDGSTDNTKSIIASFEDKLPIKLISRKKGNWVSNTNYGLSIAQGKYACFLHQDDIWLPNRLATMKALVEKYPEASFYLHPVWFIDNQGERLGKWQCPLPKVLKSQKMVEKLLIQNFIAIPAPIFQRQTALDLGGLDETLWYTADWDFWLKLAAAGTTIYHPEALAVFRVHPDSQTIRRSSSIEDFRAQMHIVVEKHLDRSTIQGKTRTQVEKVAWFSTEVNTTLAAMVHGESTNLWQLGYNFLTLGVSGWHRYWRDSRIQERISARLKAKLQTQTQ